MSAFEPHPSVYQFPALFRLFPVKSIVNFQNGNHRASAPRITCASLMREWHWPVEADRPARICPANITLARVACAQNPNRLDDVPVCLASLPTLPPILCHLDSSPDRLLVRLHRQLLAARHAELPIGLNFCAAMAASEFHVISLSGFPSGFAASASIASHHFGGNPATFVSTAFAVTALEPSGGKQICPSPSGSA